MSERAFTILHLSDLHLGRAPQLGRWRTDYWTQSLAEDLRQVMRSTAGAHFVVISGDLTWSGQHEEFQQAKELLSYVTTKSQLPYEHLLMVPGNHDRDWSQTSSGEGDLQNFISFARDLYCERQVVNTVRIFSEPKVAFILLNSIESTDAEKSVLEVSGALQTHDLRGFLLVAVLHHDLDELQQTWRASETAPLILRRLLSEWNVHLVLQGSVHQPANWTLLENPFGKQLRLACGRGWFDSPQTLLPPSYNVVMVDSEKVKVERRVYDNHRGTWIGDPTNRFAFLLERRQLGLAPPLRKESRTSPERIRTLCEEIAELSPQDLNSLLRELEPSIPSYSPMQEPRSAFAKRLVDYYEHRVKLFVLEEAILRYRQASAKVRVFIAHSARDRDAAAKLARIVRDSGHDTWFDDWSLKLGESIASQITEAVRTSDVFLFLLTGGSATSSVLLELGMWIGMRGASRVIVVSLGEGKLPETFEIGRTIRVRDPKEIEGKEFIEQLRGSIVLSAAERSGPRSSSLGGVDKGDEPIRGDTPSGSRARKKRRRKR